MNLQSKKDRMIGTLLASALGDAFGAPYEGGLPERLLWALIGWRKGVRRWTDDTQMSIDIVESLLACGEINQDDLAWRFASSYRWSRGYGPGAAKLLRRIHRGEDWRTANRAVFPNGSYGNGGAMRVAPVGLFYADDEQQLVRATRSSAAVTHAHPLGQDGAVLIALTTASVYIAGDDDLNTQEIIQRLRRHVRTSEFQPKLVTAEKWLRMNQAVVPRTVATELGNGIKAVDSCVTAIYAALAFRKADFADLLAYIRRIGGDVDTIGAMAGAIWGAACGRRRLPEEYLRRLERRKYLEQLGAALAQASSARCIKRY
jgi:poly(ADP-ribose) glycohydrolase ARH3